MITVQLSTQVLVFCALLGLVVPRTSGLLLTLYILYQLYV
jgi:hypothetical protein